MRSAARLRDPPDLARVDAQLAKIDPPPEPPPASLTRHHLQHDIILEPGSDLSLFLGIYLELHLKLLAHQTAAMREQNIQLRGMIEARERVGRKRRQPGPLAG